jgi:hypothetical protein
MPILQATTRLRVLERYWKDPAGDKSGGTFVPRLIDRTIQQCWVDQSTGEEVWQPLEVRKEFVENPGVEAPRYQV